jgi:outer membrane lipoprotein-sorting protein
MKKILLLLLLPGMYFSGYSQTDAKAKTILAEASKKYKAYDVVKATFVFTMENPQNKQKDTQQGTLIVQSATNKYKVVMTDQDMISDGKSQWTYLKKDKEVQVSAVDNSSDALNPAGIFTLYEKGFKYLYTGEKKEGTKTYQMIDLSPVDTQKSYFKIRLGIDKSAHQIANVLIFDKNGNKYTYVVKTFTANVKVPAGTFGFDPKKYPGVEVVDLR